MQDECIASLKRRITLTQIQQTPILSWGMAYYKKKSFDKAINEFKQTIELNPKDAEAHNYLGTLYYEQGALGKSIVEHKSAIQSDKNYPEAFNNLGIVLYAKGNLRKLQMPLKKHWNWSLILQRRTTILD